MYSVILSQLRERWPESVLTLIFKVTRKGAALNWQVAALWTEAWRQRLVREENLKDNGIWFVVCRCHRNTEENTSSIFDHISAPGQFCRVALYKFSLYLSDLTISSSTNGGRSIASFTLEFKQCKKHGLDRTRSPTLQQLIGQPTGQSRSVNRWSNQNK